MKDLVLCGMSLALACGTARAEARRTLTQIADTPFKDGFCSKEWKFDNDTKSNQYRIPAVAAATNGIVVAVYDLRYTSDRDLGWDVSQCYLEDASGRRTTIGKRSFAPLDIAETVSTDGGRTWGKPRMAIDVPNATDPETGAIVYARADAGLKDYDIGDPSIVYDPVTNEFLLMAITGGGLRASGVRPGANEVNDVVLYTRPATADGAWKPWTRGANGGRSIKAIAVAALIRAMEKASPKDTVSLNRLKANTFCGIYQNTAHGFVTTKTVSRDGAVVMPAGTIVFPMQFLYTAGSGFYCFALYSTDHGATWEATSLEPGLGQEGSMVELDDGSWAYMVKDCNPTQKIVSDKHFFRTIDFLNWGEMPKVPKSQVTVQGSMFRIGTRKSDGRGVYAAAWCHAYERAELTMTFGVDETAEFPNDSTRGIAWDASGAKLPTIMIHREPTGGKGYNSMFLLDATTLGLVYEAHYHIYLDAIDISEYLK